MTACARCGVLPGDQPFFVRYQALERQIRLCESCAAVASRITALDAATLEISASANWAAFKTWIEADQPRGWLPYGKGELILFFYPLYLIESGGPPDFA